jgi:hypothetical protein
LDLRYTPDHSVFFCKAFGNKWLKKIVIGTHVAYISVNTHVGSNIKFAMKLSRIQLLFLGFIIFLAPFVIYRLIWLTRSSKTKEVVLYIKETMFTRPSQTYPVIQFETNQYTVTVSGHYNAPYEEGDSVRLRYIPSNPTNFKVDTFWNCWVDVFIWAGFLLLLASFLLVRNIIPRKNFILNKRGISQLD